MVVGPVMENPKFYPLRKRSSQGAGEDAGSTGADSAANAGHTDPSADGAWASVVNPGQAGSAADDAYRDDAYPDGGRRQWLE